MHRAGGRGDAHCLGESANRSHSPPTTFNGCNPSGLKLNSLPRDDSTAVELTTTSSGPAWVHHTCGKVYRYPAAQPPPDSADREASPGGTRIIETVEKRPNPNARSSPALDSPPSIRFPRMGGLVWSGEGLAPGLYTLRVVFPRPTWFAASTDVQVVVEGRCRDKTPMSLVHRSCRVTPQLRQTVVVFAGIDRAAPQPHSKCPSSVGRSTIVRKDPIP